jgi:hypothetical protein
MAITRFWAQHQADGTFRVLPSFEGPAVAAGGQLPDDWVQLTFLCTNVVEQPASPMSEGDYWAWQEAACPETPREMAYMHVYEPGPHTEESDENYPH